MGRWTQRHTNGPKRVPAMDTNGTDEEERHSQQECSSMEKEWRAAHAISCIRATRDATQQRGESKNKRAACEAPRTW
eukprot:scaffold2859_cov349-Pavlova_lutheri.AAC.47